MILDCADRRRSELRLVAPTCEGCQGPTSAMLVVISSCF